nr:RNA-directed DNA polymerase, eukaryota [Tanacetum cinerariifolium]
MLHKERVANFEQRLNSHTPVRIEAPSELPKVSLVNESLKKLKYHLASFDKVVKKKTISDAITVDEITEVQAIFNQMEAAVDQCSVDKNSFEIQIKQLCIDNDQLLNQIKSQEIVHIVVNSVDILDVSKSVKCSTGASRLKPSSNTKNNKISQPSCSNKTNKVEDQSRSIKSRKNKKNHVVKTKCNAHVMQSMLNANSKSVCANCSVIPLGRSSRESLLYSKSIINPKTSQQNTVELLRDRKPYLSYLHVFGALCYPTNDGEDLATSLILINGSPTHEFNINRRLRQGDPLSPFLFFIAMEVLYVAVEDTLSVGIYWVSGLKINIHKSNLVGVGVPFEEVNHFALTTGYNAMQSPFLYLGLLVDCNMANTKSWGPIFDKFSKRLSKWKSSLLLIGGRSTLISLVLGAIGTYHFSLFLMPVTVNNKLESLRSNFFWGSNANVKKILWISWKLVLASKDKEGLGIGSFYSLNHALIQKWRWHFFNDPQSLWVLLIKAIHDENGDASSFYNHVRDQGVWGRIVRSINSMHEKGLVPHSFLQRHVNNDASTKFWSETWMDDSLKNQFPLLFRLALNKYCTTRDRWNNGWALDWSRPITGGTNANHLSTLFNMLATCSLTDSDDTWTWSLGSPTFIVKSTRDHINQCTLPDGGFKTRCNRYLSKKINIFIWRALRDRLPTRWNLSRKGIDMESLTCLIFDSSIETTNHTLWFCSLATTLWQKIFFDLVSPSPSNIQDVYSWLEDMRFPSSYKSILEVICGVVIWSLWNFRNELIFATTPPKRSILFDKIVDCSYRWYSTRNKLSSSSWKNWIQNPLMVSIL